MHGGLILAILTLALWLRWVWRPTPDDSWSLRWQSALTGFCLPPLMLLSSAIAVLWMGCYGHMLGLPVGRYGCWLAALILGLASAALLVTFGQGCQSCLRLRHYPVIWVERAQARCIPEETAFAAQVGFWRPQLIVSQGLLTHLNHQELQAVLAHEQAHAYFHDTFWFFWLGWLRRLTCWLPHTEALWQELLLLREIRADRQATQAVDALLLAEVLVKLVALPLQRHPSVAEAFSHSPLPGRLEQRVEALIAVQPVSEASSHELAFYLSLLLGLMPLATVLLHN